VSVIIAGDRSGAGKTTITLALLAGLSQRGTVQSFKVGPDYIDPMFHRAVTGQPCRNLDPILTSPSYVQACFDRHTQGVDFAVIEGVMGLFDGVTMPATMGLGDRPDFASTAHIARILDLPVILVIDCRSLSGSIAAIVHGFSSFDPQVKIAGLILNQVGSDRHAELLKTALLPLGIPLIGILRRDQGLVIPDRHLGLVPTAELNNLSLLLEQLTELGETCFDWEKLVTLSSQSHKNFQESIDPQNQYFSTNKVGSAHPTPVNPRKIKIGVALDRAFSFYYQDNLDLLEELGAELVFWSPLQDQALPAEVQGLYFGGGFPEVFAPELAENQAGRSAVQRAISGGMPTYAECGGLMYLSQGIQDFQGETWDMVGVLPTQAVMGSRLTLGYRHATALGTGLVMEEGQQVWGHEFHRSTLTQSPPHLFRQYPPESLSNCSMTALWHTESLSNISAFEGWALPHLHASYIHLHWGNTRSIPRQFLQKIAAYAATNK
jgi:cobyrinic acid a,c-diamide synthase